MTYEVALFTKDGQQLTRFLPVEDKLGPQRISFGAADKIASGPAAEAVIYENDADGSFESVQTVDLDFDPYRHTPDGVMVDPDGPRDEHVDLHLFGELNTSAQ